ECGEIGRSGNSSTASSNSLTNALLMITRSRSRRLLVATYRHRSLRLADHMGWREPYASDGRSEVIAPHGPIDRELFRAEKVHSDWVMISMSSAPRVPTMRKNRESAMHKARMTAALVLIGSLAGAAAWAQTAPQQPQDVLAPAPKLNLTLEQRHTIREFI